MKKGTKWAIGLSTVVAVLLVFGVIVAKQAFAIFSVAVSQAAFYNNGWSMIDSDWEEYMGYICDHNIDEEDLDYNTYLEQRESLKAL